MIKPMQWAEVSQIRMNSRARLWKHSIRFDSVWLNQNQRALLKECLKPWYKTNSIYVLPFDFTTVQVSVTFFPRFKLFLFGIHVFSGLSASNRINSEFFEECLNCYCLLDSNKSRLFSWMWCIFVERFSTFSYISQWNRHFFGAKNNIPNYKKAKTTDKKPSLKTHELYDNDLLELWHKLPSLPQINS